MAEIRYLISDIGRRTADGGRRTSCVIVIPSVERNLFCDTLWIMGLGFGLIGVRTRITQCRFLAALGIAMCCFLGAVE